MRRASQTISEFQSALSGLCLRHAWPPLAGFYALLAVLAVLALTSVAVAQSNDNPDGQPPTSAPAKPPAFQSEQQREGTMTLERMDEIVKRLDKNAKSPRLGFWQLEVEKRTVTIVTDAKNDRMRIMVPVGPAENVSPEVMKRLMQANFDTALDSRYAVARDILWATYIHPLRALHDRQFVTAIGQTVNLVATFGTTFSSGLLNFGGGDSRGIIQRQLIDGLLQKGLPI